MLACLALVPAVAAQEEDALVPEPAPQSEPVGEPEAVGEPGAIEVEANRVAGRRGTSIASDTVLRYSRWQDACYSSSAGRGIGPLQASLLDGMLGVPHRACPRTEIALGADAYAVADGAHFYGNIRIDGRIAGSLAYSPDLEIFASFEAVRYQSLISAVSSSYVGLGYLTAGAMGRVYHEHGRVIGVTGRLVMPTTTGLDRNNQPIAFEASSTAGFTATENFRFHAWLALIASLGLNAVAPFQGRAGVRAGGGVDWHPWDWLAVVLEVATGFGYRDALDFFALQPGLRFGFGPEVAMELSASLPLAGAERALGAAWLMLSWAPPR